MPSFEMLDVLIGLITVYLSFALACTAVMEALSAWANLRGKNLVTALEHLLARGTPDGGAAAAAAFLRSTLIEPLGKFSPRWFGIGGELTRRAPGSLPPALVAKVLAELAGSHAAVGQSELLRLLKQQAGGDLKQLEAAIESQYDAVMDRASGWYKRWAQNVTLVLAALLVIFADVDTIAIARHLSASPEARAAAVGIAQVQLEAGAPAPAAAAEPTASAALARTATAREQVAAARAVQDSLLPIGQPPWGDRPWSVERLVGWLISIAAISLGAPFWFSLLQRAMKVRSPAPAPTEKDQ